MEILENLQNLHIVQGRLLYLVQEMNLMGRITVQEKLILKRKRAICNARLEMVLREEKELIDIISEFIDQESGGDPNLTTLENLMLRIEEYLHERILGGEPSFDTEPPNAATS